MKKRSPAFILFLVVMALICACGVLLLVAGSRSHVSAPVPWLLPRGIFHG